MRPHHEGGPAHVEHDRTVLARERRVQTVINSFRIPCFIACTNLFSIRFPIKPLRTVAVMVVSSVWHGVHSGYYLSLGSVPFVLIVEDLMAKVLRRNLSQKVPRLMQKIERERNK